MKKKRYGGASWLTDNVECTSRHGLGIAIVLGAADWNSLFSILPSFPRQAKEHADRCSAVDELPGHGLSADWFPLLVTLAFCSSQVHEKADQCSAARNCFNWVQHAHLELTVEKAGGPREQLWVQHSS